MTDLLGNGVNIGGEMMSMLDCKFKGFQEYVDASSEFVSDKKNISEALTAS